MKTIQKRIEEEYANNCTKIDDLNKKITAINANDFGDKVAQIIGLSLFPWTITVITMPFIIKLGLIPLNFVQPLIIGAPILTGIATNSLLDRLIIKKGNWKNESKNFSKAKTQKQRLEESTRYEIEKQKLLILNEALEEIQYDLLKQDNLNGCFEKSKDNETPEEITTNINEINDTLIKKEQNTSIMATKYVLEQTIEKVKNNFKIFHNIMIGGLFCMAACSMPIACLNQFQGIQISFKSIQMLYFFIIGGMINGGYYFKEKKDHISVFKKINEELGDNAIPNSNVDKNDNHFNENLATLIKDTSIIKLQLEIEKQKLENASTSSTIVNLESVNNDLSKSTIFENYVSLFETLNVQEVEDEDAKDHVFMKIKENK